MKMFNFRLNLGCCFFSLFLARDSVLSLKCWPQCVFDFGAPEIVELSSVISRLFGHGPIDEPTPVDTSHASVSVSNRRSIAPDPRGCVLRERHFNSTEVREGFPSELTCSQW